MLGKVPKVSKTNDDEPEKAEAEKVSDKKANSEEKLKFTKDPAWKQLRNYNMWILWDPTGEPQISSGTLQSSAEQQNTMLVCSSLKYKEVHCATARQLNML